MEDKFFSSTLNNLLNPDNSLRQAAELQYNIALTQSPEQVILNLLHILTQNSDQTFVSLSAVLLKRNFELKWKILNKASQLTIKRLILKTFSSTLSFKSLKIATDVLSKLAICVKQNSELWSEFSVFLFSSISGKEDWQIFVGFKVLSEVFAYYPEELAESKEKLYQSFLKNFFHAENEIRAECCLCFLQAISVFSTAETKYFVGLLQVFFKSVLGIQEGVLVERVMESLRDLAETEPLFLKNRMVWCLQFTEGVIRGGLDIRCKYLGLEFLLVLTESFPNLILASLQTVFGYLELFRMTFEEVAGLNIDSIDINYENLILALIARSVKILRGNFAKMILEYLNTNTQRSPKFKYFSILLLSEAAVEMFGTTLFEPLMKYVKESMNGGGKVHFACLRTFKKFILKFQTRFTGKYLEAIEEAIKTGLNTQDSEIIKETLDIFVEFLKSLHNYELRPEQKEIFLLKILEYIKLEPVQEPALKAVEAACDSFKRSVPWFFDQFYPILIQLFSNSQKLSVKVLICNTLISLRKTVKRKTFSSHLPEIFTVLKTLSSDFSSEPFKTCVLDNWKFIVKHIGSDFSFYLTEIVPDLLLHINSEKEDIEEHLETLLVIIESTQESFFAFLNATSKIIINLITNEVSDPVRALSCAVGAVLVEVALKTSSSDSKENVISFSKQFFAAICQVCTNEHDVSTLADMLQSLQRIISAPGQSFLTKSEIEGLSEMLVKFLHSQSASPQLRQTASQVLSTMFKTHTNSTVHLLDFIYANLVEKYLSSSLRNEKIFALAIFSDILSVVGNMILPEKLEKILTVLLGYAKDGERKVRIEAIKGIIEGAKALDRERFKLYAEGILKGLESVILNTVDKKTERKVFEWAVAAVLYMVTYQEACLKVEMLLLWIAEFLPVEKIVVAGRVNEIFVGCVVEKHSGLVDYEEVLNALVRVSASGECRKGSFRKIKNCIVEHFKYCGVEELYGKIQEQSHGYLHKLLL